MNRLNVTAALALAALSACSSPSPRVAATSGPGGAPPSQAALAACRERADEIYLKQNRVLLSERDQRDTPFTSSGMPSNTAAGLGQLYGRDQNVAHCLNNYGPPGSASLAGAGTSPAMDQTNGSMVAH